MCEISSVTKINNDILIGCTSYDGDFMNAGLLKIFDGVDNIYETEDFIIDKSRPCFNTQTVPWIMLKKDIPNEFLHKGNKIEFS